MTELGREDEGVKLTEFLLARIAEDERVARVADIGVGHGVRPDELWTVTNPPRGEVCAIPSRVLAECDAKRRIVTEVVEEIDSLTSDWADATDATPFTVDYPSEKLLRLLALPYADHPDSREEWRLDS